MLCQVGHCTCQHSAYPCPAFMVAITYAHLVVADWTCFVSVWARTWDGLLPAPVLHPHNLKNTNPTLSVFICHLKTLLFFPARTVCTFEISTKMRSVSSLLLWCSEVRTLSSHYVIWTYYKIKSMRKTVTEVDLITFVMSVPIWV